MCVRPLFVNLDGVLQDDSTGLVFLPSTRARTQLSATLLSPSGIPGDVLYSLLLFGVRDQRAGWAPEDTPNDVSSMTGAVYRLSVSLSSFFMLYVRRTE